MTAWPPERLSRITQVLEENNAWYTGDRKELERIYSWAPENRSVTNRLGKLWRRFWNGRVEDPTVPAKIKVHVPLAADIARGSADLLFGEPPSITSEDETTNEAIQGFLDDGLVEKLAAAAEVAAALGGVYLRAMFDTATNRVFSTRVDYDCADPVFAFGELLAVTFWRKVAEDGNTVWWWLEIHELDAQGFGVIRHELYEGSAYDLGAIATLDQRPETAGLLNLAMTEDGAVTTGSPGLAVVHVPNVTPNALWRNHPVGANLGQSDFAGSYDLLDRLDHTNSALLNEVDLGEAMITIPEGMLKSGTSGQGVQWDRSRNIFTTINVPPTEGGAQIGPELFQPDIRVEKYLSVMQQLTEDILRRAGYSAQTFGEDETGGAATATEVNSRDRRSEATRSRKLRHWQPAVQQLVSKMLAIGAALNILPGVDPESVKVDFPDANQAAPLTLAQTVLAMSTAVAASIETKVRTLHPDWDDIKVTEEVSAIKSETGVSVEDPSTFTGFNQTPVEQTAGNTAPPFGGSNE